MDAQLCDSNVKLIHEKHKLGLVQRMIPALIQNINLHVLLSEL